MPDSIQVIDLRKRYRIREGLRRVRFVEALRGVNFKVEKGSIHALLGPNGAGKTTTVKIISTLLLPDAGDAYVQGYSATKEPDKVRELISVVLDVSKGFYSSLTGFENLVFYAVLRGYSLGDARRAAKHVLEVVGLESLRASHRPYFTYSLGMRARLALAKALLTDPEVLLLDEPTLGLDVESQNMVRELLVKLSKKGKTILITGHNMNEIERISHFVTIINNGIVVASGTPEDLKKGLGLFHKIELRVENEKAEAVESAIRTVLSPARIFREDHGTTTKIVAYMNATREEIVSALFKTSRDLGVKIYDLKLEEPSLEDAYLAIVGEHR